jgi:diguanylate cyclase (GGDEF)-like protein/PAS domain S-box-containing protein
MENRVGCSVPINHDIHFNDFAVDSSTIDLFGVLKGNNMDITRTSFADIVDNLYDGLYVVDRNRIITYWNKAAERISGFSAQEVVGKSCSENILTHVDNEGNSLCLEKCPLAAGIADGKRREAEVYMHHKDGYRIPVSCRFGVLRDDENNVIGGVELFTDISNQKVRESRIKELEKIAMLDKLTQLPNRNYLDKEIERRFEEKKLYSIPFGILFMDIDHFKKFNDTYGHDVGDMVLKFVANTLVGSTRTSDVFGRWGGEEFIGILRNINHQDLETLGNRVRVLVENSYIIHGNEKLHVTISVGATLGRDDDTIDSLLKRADTALYKSKSAGRNCLTIG